MSLTKFKSAKLDPGGVSLIERLTTKTTNEQTNRKPENSRSESQQKVGVRKKIDEPNICCKFYTANN